MSAQYCQLTHNTSCLFGTFMLNNHQARVTTDLHSKTHSLWDLIAANVILDQLTVHVPDTRCRRPSTPTHCTRQLCTPRYTAAACSTPHACVGVAGEVQLEELDPVEVLLPAMGAKPATTRVCRPKNPGASSLVPSGWIVCPSATNTRTARERVPGTRGSSLLSHDRRWIDIFCSFLAIVPH